MEGWLSRFKAAVLKTAEPLNRGSVGSNPTPSAKIAISTGVVENMAYHADLKSDGPFRTVWVRVPPTPPIFRLLFLRRYVGVNV